MFRFRVIIILPLIKVVGINVVSFDTIETVVVFWGSIIYAHLNSIKNKFLNLLFNFLLLFFDLKLLFLNLFCIDYFQTVLISQQVDIFGRTAAVNISVQKLHNKCAVSVVSLHIGWVLRSATCIELAPIGFALLSRSWSRFLHDGNRGTRRRKSSMHKIGVAIDDVTTLGIENDTFAIAETNDFAAICRKSAFAQFAISCVAGEHNGSGFDIDLRDVVQN
mmetsp:Transcript_33347/g.65537  ORF Transcript_33347/g.65537 Transcript_33347/m.65537 type:complete len:220 (-) Transcript_33347:5627-6286(-)